jgi:cell wall-associated NlpC family hydrolase
MTFRPVRILTALTFGVALSVLFPGYAPAQPSDDIQARAAQLENDLNASNAQVAALGQQLDDADARIKVAQDEIARIKSLINERAASIYKVAGVAGPFDAINAQDAQDLAARSKYSDIAASHDDALIDELAAAKADLAAERGAVAKAKSDAEAAAAEQNRLLDQVNGEIEAALRTQTAARAAEAPKVSGPAPLGNGGGGAAAAYAQAQVGKAYCNTNPDRFGPGCYDCSGLTYMAWRAGGLEIPKISGPQGSAYPRVNNSELQPGDLITISSWSAHVGIWVGGGYVHATTYRNNPNGIKFVAGSGGIVDAVRPG